MEENRYNHLKEYLILSLLPSDKKLAKQIQQQSKHFVVLENQLFKKDKRNQGNYLKVLKSHEIESVLYATHNHLTGGHLGIEKVFEKVRENYYWPQMFEDIRNYIKGCDSCQRRGKPSKKTLLHPIPVGKPFEKIGIDFDRPLPLTNNGNKYIIVATDYLTKWPEASATSAADANTVVEFIYENIICRHGCPNYILSDRGSHFRNKVVDGLMNKFEIKHLLSTPYHPQTNGLVERFNKTLCESIAKTTRDLQEWDTVINSVLFAYRTAKNSTTKYTPFYLTYGREARLPITTFENETLESNLENLEINRQKAKDNVTKAQEKQKSRHDSKIKKPIEYQIGDKVLLYEAAKEKTWTGKLEDKWKGPFYIHDKLLNGAYKLRSTEGRILKTPINASLLKIYNDRQNWDPVIYLE